MFNGYHEPSATSYNDLELDRGKKNQSASKWTCGNGTSIQSTHLHPQNQQPEIWVSKPPPFIGLPNAAPTNCNCPSCYQLPESQSYQGDIPWHRSWFSRTYPVAVNATHDLVKIPSNHHWENAGFPSESYPTESGVNQFVQEGGDKPVFYKPYSGLRHDVYQPGVISTVKKVSRKQDLPKQDDVMPNIAHHPRYAASNTGYESFRTVLDQRLIDERTNYCNQNDKFLNADSCRQQVGLGQHALNPNRRTILESFSKTVPLNANQNRVPSVGQRNVKDNDYHSCIDQNDAADKPGSYVVNHVGADDKHCKPHYQAEVNTGQENLGLMTAFSTGDYHPVGLNRELPDVADKDFQKYVNGRNPQYFPRNNMSDVINRNPNSVLNYNLSRKGVINVPSGSARAAQTPPKHSEIVSKSQNFAKDCLVDKMSPGQKLMMNNNAKMPSERFHKGNEIPRSETILHGHITRPVMDTIPPDKIYNSVTPQNVMYKGYRRPQEYYQARRGVQQRPYEYPNEMIPLRNDLPVGINLGAPNYPDLRKGWASSNAFPQDGSPHHYQLTGESKTQSSSFAQTQSHPKSEKISHLEAIPYEELCKNGTSKISPLRLLRKKKLVHQKKEEVAETVAPDAVTKSSSPPLDVRRFWATWADEEEDNVLQPQMVVLDCHNIDPEQAGLLHLYNPDGIRTVNLEDGHVLDVKSGGNEQLNGKTSSFDEKLNPVQESERTDVITQSEVKVPASNESVGKTPEFSLTAPVIVDPVVEGHAEAKTNVIVQPNHFRKVAQSQPTDEAKELVMFPNGEYNNQKSSENEKPVLTKTESNPEKEVEDVKEGSQSSDSSDDSQTGNLPTLPDLPTSEYRKNKFLDYSDDNFCNGSFILDGIASRESRRDESVGHVDEKPKDFVPSKHSELTPGSFEIDDILKKLSDINFQGSDVGTASPGLSDSPDRHKTDKKTFEWKKDKKFKKLSHKPSRTDQVTVQNISLTKPTIKFSIQKSHDLKISFKVLNNKKKHEEDENAASDEDNPGDGSPEIIEDGEITDRLKKNKRRLITLKLKGVSDVNDDVGLWDEDSTRKSKKKKKIRCDRSPSHKTPVLKIKKSRYMSSYESGEVAEACNGTADDASKSSESEGTTHGDFRVHETVDSAKIRLTFKRNRNGGDRKEKCGDNDDVTDGTTGEVAGVTDPCRTDTQTDREPVTPSEKEEPNGESIDSNVKEDEDMNNDPNDESGPTLQPCEPSETAVSISNLDEVMTHDFKTEDTTVDIVDDAPTLGNLLQREQVEQCETEDPPEQQTNIGETEAIDENTDEPLNARSVDEDVRSVTKPDDVTDMEVVDDKPNEEGCPEDELIVPLEALLESEGAEKTEEEQEKSPIGNADVAVEKMEDESTCQASPVSNQEEADCEGLEGIDCCTDAAELLNDSLCDTHPDEVVTEVFPGSEEKLTNYSPEQLKSGINTDLVHNSGRGPENVQPSEEMKEVESSVVLTDVDCCKIDDEDMEVRETEQNDSEVTLAEDQKMEEENQSEAVVTQENELGMEDIVEENNNVRPHRKETVFVTRKIVRRRSDEDTIREQDINLKRVTRRSTSLNIELTVTVDAEPEMTMLDIDVSDIPLPPGDAPPENCLNLEEYFKSKLLEIEKKTVVEDDVQVATSLEGLPVPTVNEPEENVSCDADESNVKNGPDAEETTEIRIEDLEVFETRDTDITLEESAFRAEQLYECSGLAFDEALTITDDMEEEKVSDDDKFRNMMQNCLDNAKKFLSVGNLKLSPPADDLIEKSDSHVSKDVLLTSCDDFIIPDGRHQSMDLSLDCAPSFCTDAGSNPCSEILPVDNWPYLEEEVASSPVRNKTEESDLMCYLGDISSTENLSAGKRQQRGSLYDWSARSIGERRRTIEAVGRWKAFCSTDDALSDAENFILNGDKIKGLSAELLRYSKKSGQIYHRKLKKRMKPYSDSEGKPCVKRTSAYYKSSSWQPKVVLFRISKNSMRKLSVLPDKNREDGDVINRDKTRNPAQPGKVREDEKPRADGVKHKKTRFRNLHTKKRLVPESTDHTKENKSRLVDAESDSDESSQDPPKQIVHSHVKSTKSSEKRKSSEDASRKRDDRDKRKRDSRRPPRPCWSCEVCGFSDVAERATHIQSHPFHCQSCHLAFKTETNFVEHLTRKHKDIRNQHHCLLCELSFDLEKDYYRHLETREHRHLESVEKNTINTLFRLLTGQPCPVLGSVETKPEWLPSQAGTVHFYHQATPLSLALQYLKLNNDAKKVSTGALSPSEIHPGGTVMALVS